jgi:hypothetical protein
MRTELHNVLIPIKDYQEMVEAIDSKKESTAKTDKFLREVIKFLLAKARSGEILDMKAEFETENYYIQLYGTGGFNYKLKNLK